jgi:hypothetical protein
MGFSITHVDWLAVLLGQILSGLGTLGSYSVFILMASFWAHSIKSVENEELFPDLSLRSRRASERAAPLEDGDVPKRGPLHGFAAIMVAFLIIQAGNYTLFLLRVYNAQGMVLYESLVMCLISLATLIEISVLSHRFRAVLSTFSSINSNNTDRQKRRIRRITIGACAYLSFRTVLEACMASSLLLLWHSGDHFEIILHNRRYWDVYLAGKFVPEVFILILELAVTRAMEPRGWSWRAPKLSGAGWAADGRTDATHDGERVRLLPQQTPMAGADSSTQHVHSTVL